LHSADVKDKLTAQGALAVGNSSAEFASYVQSEIERWGTVIAATGHQDQMREKRGRYNACSQAAGINR
jgi:tripartite-type tricarboxylate transporter receptor subunit TctC